jgi:folylpolyglutamate synthase/dihydropteroate synthase
VTARHLPADRVFFDEWSRLHTITKRSIPRATLFAEAMGVALHEVPTIVVVGSKGKATAATLASAALFGAGHRVGTITSPPILTNRERIRVNGLAIDERAYVDLAARAEAALRTMPETPGYLSPAGMYLIAGLDHFRRERCDILVVEAGMGGRSDEVSLLDPAVLIATPIFLEHAGILGDTVDEIRAEKLGAAGPNTRTVTDALEGARLLDPRATLDGVTIHLPGRMTTHIDDDGRTWLVDAAVNADGVARAVEHAHPDFVLVSLPDGKDIAATAAWLDTHMRDRWLPVKPRAAEHLSYASWDRAVRAWDPAFVTTHRHIATLGSWSFIAEVLAMLGVENERAFRSTTG